MLNRLIISLISGYFFFSTNVLAQEKLIFAIDLVRHGDRTPTMEIPKSPYHWTQSLGELTDEGKDQERKLGVELRQKYVDQYHLLPANYAPQTLYVRSTDMSRTIESAKALLSGLYPNTQINIVTLPKSEDHLLVVKPSNNIFSLLKLYWATHRAWKEKTAPLTAKLKSWNNATGLRLNGFQKVIALADNLSVRKLHHVALPAGISDQDANEIIALGDWGITHGFKLPEISQPMGQSFLSTISNYFQQAAQQRNPLKYALFLAHDASIMAVMATMGAPLEQNPPYASDLNFSLFQDGSEYHVKISLNHQPVVLEKCNHSDTCSLEQFIALGN